MEENKEIMQDTETENAAGGWLRFVLGFAAGFAVCIGVLAVLLYGVNMGRIIPAGDYDYYEDLSNKYGKYYVIMDMIGEDPLTDKKPEDITEDSIKEIVDNLGDPYAAYFTPEEYKDFTKHFEADYVGVGIMVEQTEDSVVVNQVFEDGPAHKAGMKAGDVILKVDGTAPEDLDDAVSRMTGEEGTEVTVTVGRGGREIDLEMTRARIDMASVAYDVSDEDPEVGYIRVLVFAEDTDKEFEEAVKRLQDKGCDKFIVDLRDNSGGLTDVSINMADYLLPECRIMSEISKDGTEKVYDSEKSSADLDMVVLVNENTASASEILTAAIKENDAGKVIGTKTFGKGVTQITRQFKDGSAIKMTVTEYLTPDGNHVQEVGIEPDIEASDEDIMDKAIEALND